MRYQKLSYYSRKIITMSCIYFVMFMVIFFASELSSGIKNGIAISLNLIIPSLFIFMILSNIIVRSSLGSLIASPFRFFAKKMFKIQYHHFSIVILSLIGGYPIGAKMIANAIADKQMSVKTGERMLCYCVNCGPAFLIGAIGTNIFQNAKIGVIIYISQVIACFFVGYMTTVFLDTKQENQFVNTHKQEKLSSTLLVNSVNDAIKSLVVICSFIVAFSAFMPLVELFTQELNDNIKYLLKGILEVSTGCEALRDFNSPHVILLATIFTSFGGMCVFLQICAMVKSSKIKLTKFLAFRLIYTGISTAIVYLAMKFMPDTIACIGIPESQVHQIHSVSPLATIFLFFMCILLLFYSKKSDKMNIE